MIWCQLECKFGDMIRVSFGNFYHYGIFVSDDEVIQFGLPPTEGLLNRKNEDISVCISDIDTFSGGKTVEVATVEKADKQKRLTPKKTVQRARAKIGEKGYDILHNNCEHFARYCYLGEKRCEVAEGVVKAWKDKTVCDIYFSRIPQSFDATELFPKERHQEVLSVTNEQVKRSKYWAWKTLEYALLRTFGFRIQDLGIVKTKTGKWVCDKCFFSISHCGDFIAVSVSNRETGIDVESQGAFLQRTANQDVMELLAKKVVSKREEKPRNALDLLKLWTQKECCYKVKGKGAFIPHKIAVDSKKIATLQVENGQETFTVSVYCKEFSAFRFYTFDGAGAARYRDVQWL